MSEANEIRRKHAEEIIKDVRTFTSPDFQEALRSFVVISMINAEMDINDLETEQKLEKIRINILGTEQKLKNLERLRAK